MKTRISIFVFFICTLSVFSQSADFNLKKYWYLKWRLMNYFIVVGPNYGESIPFGIRNWSGGTDVNVGDTPNYLATYIGVLATELKLLKDNNLDYSETKRQLYYALYAVNRFDDCEGMYPWSGFDASTYANAPFPSTEFPVYSPNSSNLNGACVRGDTPNNFVATHEQQLNRNLAINFTHSSNYGDPKTILGNEHEGLNHQFTNSTQGLVNFMIEGNTNPYVDYDNALAKIRAGSMLSQDHISSLLVAMALVVKSVDNYESYNSIPFQDNKAGFVEEAKAITSRLINYMSDNNGNSGVTDQYRLFAISPSSTEIEHRWGGNARPFSYGFASAASWILHNTNTNNSGDYFNTTAWGEGFNLWQTFDVVPTFFSASVGWIYLNLYCVGNRGGSGPLTLLSTINQQKIYACSVTHNWQSYYPLLHAYLHSTGCDTDQDRIEYDLDKMPCSGHYKIKLNQINTVLSEEWATSHKYHDSYSENNGNGGFEGKFNSLEYMLLFNLYCLHSPSYIGNYKSHYQSLSETPKSNYPATEILVAPFIQIPYTVGANPVSGSNAWIVPESIFNFKTIESDAVIQNGSNTTYEPVTVASQTIFVPMQRNLTANVSYRAGESIILKPGFHAKEGAYFHAYIDPYECNSSSTGYERYASETGNDIKNNQIALNDNKKLEKPDFQTQMVENIETGMLPQEFNILPNPNNGQFTLVLPAQAGTSSRLKITNIIGETVYETTTTNNKVDVSLEYLTSGVYTIIHTTERGVQTRKMVVH